MSLLSSLLNGTLANDIVEAVDTLEKTADVIVNKLENAADVAEKGAAQVEAQTQKASRVIDVVERRLPSDQ